MTSGASGYRSMERPCLNLGNQFGAALAFFTILFSAHPSWDRSWDRE